MLSIKKSLSFSNKLYRFVFVVIFLLFFFNVQFFFQHLFSTNYNFSLVLCQYSIDTLVFVKFNGWLLTRKTLQMRWVSEWVKFVCLSIWLEPLFPFLILVLFYIFFLTRLKNVRDCMTKIIFNLQKRKNSRKDKKKTKINTEHF